MLFGKFAESQKVKTLKILRITRVQRMLTKQVFKINTLNYVAFTHVGIYVNMRACRVISCLRNAQKLKKKRENILKSITLQMLYYSILEDPIQKPA